LFVDPAAIGNGMTIFEGLEKAQNLTLEKSASFGFCIVIICYQMKYE